MIELVTPEEAYALSVARRFPLAPARFLESQGILKKATRRLRQLHKRGFLMKCSVQADNPRYALDDGTERTWARILGVLEMLRRRERIP